MQGLGRFLAFHNAVPIAISFLIVGATGAFAAVEPEAFYDTKQTIVQVDNTYIANKDLASYSPRVEILNVTEDVDAYFVAYRLHTIDVVNGTWQDVVREDTLTVAKGVLGQFGDLGLYATEQFKQMVDREVAYLKEVQEIERRQVTQKVVATEYSGLIGKLLDTSTETLPGYVPVVVEPSYAEWVPPGAVAGASTEQPQTEPAPPSSSGDTTVPQLQVLGANPAKIAVGAHYVDLGVFVTDTPVNDVSVKLFVNENSFAYAPGEVTIDTSKNGEWRIRYEATDAAGNTGVAERTVIVGAGAPAPTIETPHATSSPQSEATTTGPTPEPDLGSQE